ncbi:hypothetical protein DXN05_11680 [Deminuibacter soli]|uniref:Uncharacterized protein n=1 Tax=Deminuibacter soli TaxID=2291815 RepID=A0A3E1NJR4_9BACT|nr:hypothetical protein DXN05_11680 [Deminuibacter soli]
MFLFSFNRYLKASFAAEESFTTVLPGKGFAAGGVFLLQVSAYNIAAIAAGTIRRNFMKIGFKVYTAIS